MQAGEQCQKVKLSIIKLNVNAHGRSSVVYLKRELTEKLKMNRSNNLCIHMSAYTIKCN